MSRIAILQTDSVLDRFQPEYGDYPAMFERVLRGAAEDDPVAFEVFDCRVGSYPPDPGSFDGYVITGSRHSVYEPLCWIDALGRFVRNLVESGGRVVGVCFGHQLIAHVLGGETRASDRGWGVGVHVAQVVAREPWMHPESQEFALLCSHKDQVVRLPGGARLFAVSDFCPNAGYVIDDSVITFQGHPEFVKPYSRSLMDMRRELLGEATYRAGIESLAQPTHEGTVAAWMLNFMRRDG